ncbi:hypothetical protein EJ110_NYTH16145 [Nymphaea thermarum]|nr:hypothetical protein EJ110_NYTH16145 [Nymphaea thermarum]
MKEFDDKIPARVFDNFQFVNFTNIMSKNGSSIEKEAAFALAALMEIPMQYKAIMELGLLGHVTGNAKRECPICLTNSMDMAFGCGHMFVNFTNIKSKNGRFIEKEAAFALVALTEFPIQYKAVMELGLLGY